MPDRARRWGSLPAMMLALARERGDRPMLRHWRGGAWQTVSWEGFGRSVLGVALWLRENGVGPGDRVVIVSENRPEFLIADVAIMAIGAVTVPTYTTNTPADHAHVFRDSGARVAVVANAALAARVLAGAEEVGGLDLLIGLDGALPAPDGVRSVGWEALLEPRDDGGALLAEVQEIPGGRLACLIYTSGTGGSPKGVMLPHRAMLSNQAGVAQILGPLNLDRKRYLSFLPMSHSYEHTVGGFLLPSLGMEVVYSRGADRIAAEMVEWKPAILTTVPRLFEVLRGRITAQVEKDGGLKRRLFERALALGLRQLDGPPLGLLERVQDAVLDRLVRDKVRARFGGAVEALVSGGARLDPELSGFFLALGLPVLQGYGQSEAGPVVSVNAPWDNDRRSVGRPLPGVEVRIAEDGEILVRGDLVMDGYWGNPDATAAAIRDDGDGPWLHTGDVGHLAEGRIVITDRKRDFIKLVGGDMVAPSKLESMLVGQPEIAQAVAVGEGMAGVGALLVAAEGQQDRLGEAVARVNAKLSPIERIRRWHALPEPFSVENGLLTPTMKVKRRQVMERYRTAVAALDR
ncbi:MAG: AMP-dependent synthetase/ligase [Acetobacteraceae bacterium]|nr:AMP-dependent synthetase/ligase [Acetobacteraceae bacterium]